MHILLGILAIAVACSCALDREAKARQALDRIQGYCDRGEPDSLRIFCGELSEQEKSDPMIMDQAFSRGAQVYGAALALLCSPDSAAAQFVSRLLSLDMGKGDQARASAQSVAETYSALGMESERSRFMAATDSIASTLTLQEQARLYVLCASPGMLGVKARGEEPETIEAIEREYGCDEESLELFRKGLKGN